MNQTFSFQRWSLLVAKHWAENRRRYLLSILAFMSLIVVWYVFVMLTDSSRPLAKGLQEITYFFSLFIVGPFYASQFFKPLNSKSKAIDYLMVPASNLEKTICGIFYAVVLFPIVFTLAFYIVDITMVELVNIFHPSYNGSIAGEAIPKEKILNVFRPRDVPTKDVTYYVFLFFFAIQSAFLLGSVYFAQYSYIKTAISLSLIILILAFVGVYIPDEYMPNGFYNPPSSYEVFLENGEEKRIVMLPVWVSKTVEYLFLYGPHLVFWVTTYFRVKEKEV